MTVYTDADGINLKLVGRSFPEQRRSRHGTREERYANETHSTLQKLQAVLNVIQSFNSYRTPRYTRFIKLKQTKECIFLYSPALPWYMLSANNSFGIASCSVCAQWMPRDQNAFGFPLQASRQGRLETQPKGYFRICRPHGGSSTSTHSLLSTITC